METCLIVRSFDLCLEAHATGRAELMPIGEIGRVWPGKYERSSMTMSLRPGHKGIPNGLGIELPLREEDLLANPTKDIECKLIRSHQVVNWKIDPDIERDLSLGEFGIADQVCAIDSAKHLFDFDRKAQVRLFVSRPINSILLV